MAPRNSCGTHTTYQATAGDARLYQLHLMVLFLFLLVVVDVCCPWSRVVTWSHNNKEKVKIRKIIKIKIRTYFFENKHARDEDGAHT